LDREQFGDQQTNYYFISLQVHKGGKKRVRKLQNAQHRHLIKKQPSKLPTPAHPKFQEIQWQVRDEETGKYLTGSY